MKLFISTALLISVFLFGCNAGSMTEYREDPKSGQLEAVRYSKYYDDGDWAISGKIGISVLVDHEKREIPGVYQAEQSVGALGPDDMKAVGKVTLYVWNVLMIDESIRVRSLVVNGVPIETKGNLVLLHPHSRTGSNVGSVPIFNYGKEIPASVVFEVNGQVGSLRLTLHRRTYDELQKFFGPGGRPPYPWANQLPDPTSPSVTSPAGAGSAPSVAADH